MAIDSLNDWKQSFANLPKVGDNTWASNLSNAIAGHVNNKAVLNGGSGTTPIFTFDSATLATQLLTLPISNDASVAIEALSNCFVTALGTSTMVVATGFSFGGGTPITTFSSVTSSLIDVGSITAFKNKIKELENVNPEDIKTEDDSPFPQLVRDAFLLLTVTTIGFDQTPPATGPLALTDPARSVI